MSEKVLISEGIHLGNGNLVLFAGPCAIESDYIMMSVAEELKQISVELNLGVVFKSSFDKANRTSLTSFRSAGLEEGLKMLNAVKEQFSMPVITDVHETSQVEEVASVVDVLQIPAFLSRQTDLILKAASTNLPVNIKKGQFLSPQNMLHATEKVSSVSPGKVFLTERGTTFGYGDLVVDFRSLPIMRKFAPVVYDVTHSIQRPGALGDSSGGDSWLGPHLAKAAVAIGVDGLFIETHPNPSEAKSDGPNMIPISQLKELLKNLIEIHGTAKSDLQG